MLEVSAPAPAPAATPYRQAQVMYGSGAVGCGITADDLSARTRTRPDHTVSPKRLAAWLIDAGLAVEDCGLLYATSLGCELGRELGSIT